MSLGKRILLFLFPAAALSLVVLLGLMVWSALR